MAQIDREREGGSKHGKWMRRTPTNIVRELRNFILDPSGPLAYLLNMAHLYWIYPLKIVIFYSYVKLPEVSWWPIDRISLVSTVSAHMQKGPSTIETWNYVGTHLFFPTWPQWWRIIWESMHMSCILMFKLIWLFFMVPSRFMIPSDTRKICKGNHCKS